MTRLSALLLLAAGSLPMFAQADYTPVFREVLRNNPSLQAMRVGTDAAKDANMTGLNLENPEVEFAYQWGNYAKINVDVSQTFDFATLSGNKKRVARSANSEAEAQYAIGRRDVLSLTDKTLTQLAYYSRLLDLYKQRLGTLADIARVSDDMLDKGACTIIDNAHTRLELERFKSEMELQKVEFESLEQQLAALNGGNPVAEITYDYDGFELPADFNTWYESIVASNPDLELAQARIELGRSNVSLSKSQGLPNFMVGYTNELIVGDNHHGFKVGMSLPLWANHGSVKSSKASLAAAHAEMDATAFALRADLKEKYDRAATMHDALASYEKVLNKTDLQHTLELAYQEGRITVLDYFSQLADLSAIQQNLLEMERDYRLALCDLKAATFR